MSGVRCYALDTGQVTSAKSFVRTVSTIEAMFNFFYVDDRDIAHVTAGRLPFGAPGTDPALPTVGTGEYDWRGFLGAEPIPRRSTRRPERSSTGTRSPPVAGAPPTTTGHTGRFSERSC